MLLKLIFRNWKRNKAFAIISIISLAIGIACTNMLVVFVIHEYNIEQSNPHRDRILFLGQDHPMVEGEKVLYSDNNTLALIKETFPEVEKSLQIQTGDCQYADYNNRQYKDVNLVVSGESFPEFFSYETSIGSLEETLVKPGCVALSEKFAKRIFGTVNPINEVITFHSVYGDEQLLRVTAVLKEREQSLLSFDALTMAEIQYGGPALVMVSKSIRPEVFEEKLNRSNIPTLLLDKGSHYLYTIPQIYFNTGFNQQMIPYLNRRNFNLIQIGILSAILILSIACFNYVNLSFSRTLQQIKLIYIQKLTGADNKFIRQQLFTDTFLTVFLAFLISQLLVFDLLPVFNSIISGTLTIGFFFNKQVLPLLLLFILILAILPGWYISRKLSGLSGSDYRLFFTGKKKNGIISLLVVLQFAFSIALITSFITVHKQVSLTKKSGHRYENIIGIGSLFNDMDFTLFQEKLNTIPGVVSSTLGSGTILRGFFKQAILQNPDGTETYLPILVEIADQHIMKTIDLKLLEGVPPEEALLIYRTPVYINRKFREKIVSPLEQPVGKHLSLYDDEYAGDAYEELIIAGIMEDFHTNSLENEIMPVEIMIQNNVSNYIQIRLNPKNKKETLTEIEKLWYQLYPDKYFTFEESSSILRNQNYRVFEMANLLLMYSIISIFLTCFGLFGITFYATEQRMKEIGVRKVNGARVFQLLFILNRRLIFCMVVAFIIVLPVTWFFLTRWLESYVYRTEIGWSSPFLALLITFVISLITVCWHSYKAANVNPVKILRSE